MQYQNFISAVRDISVYLSPSGKAYGNGSRIVYSVRSNLSFDIKNKLICGFRYSFYKLPVVRIFGCGTYQNKKYRYAHKGKYIYQMLPCVGISRFGPPFLHLLNDGYDDHQRNAQDHDLINRQGLNTCNYHICDKQNRDRYLKRFNIGKCFTDKNSTQGYQRHINVLPVAVHKLSYHIISVQEKSGYGKCDKYSCHDKSHSPSAFSENRNDGCDDKRDD